jgi:hypothetical protein
MEIKDKICCGNVGIFLKYTTLIFIADDNEGHTIMLLLNEM